MNSICKVVWSHVHQQLVVVSELVTSGGKTHSSRSGTGAVVRLRPTALALSMALGLSLSNAHAQTTNNALPTGGSVAAGSGSISSSGAHMVVDQSSQRAVINWQSFNVGKDAHVQFNNGSGATLNRVTGPEASTILGRISASGQVVISNGNGVFFGASSRVDVGSLVATTHSISNDAFMAGGDLRFERNGAAGSVVNEGDISASLQGYVALLAPEVRNSGVIVASKGTVALAAGEAITLQLNAQDQLQGVVVDAGDWKALVDNRHVVEAESGLVILSARALQSVQGGVVRHSGSINASSMTERGGRVLLTGDHITLQSGSTITATGPKGGGTVLVGGDWQGGAKADLRTTTDVIHQATTVTMDSGASIDVSATDHGKGGTILLWSDIHNPQSVTTVRGSLRAVAGPNGGDGGRIETSGYVLDTLGATVRAHAPKGKAGLWLLDPEFSLVTQALADGFADTLNTGTSVTNLVSGDMVWQSGVSLIKTAGGDSHLTLETTDGGNITLETNARIESRSGALDVTVKADGKIDVQSGVAIITNGGNARFIAMGNMPVVLTRKDEKEPKAEANALEPLSPETPNAEPTTQPEAPTPDSAPTPQTSESTPQTVQPLAVSAAPEPPAAPAVEPDVTPTPTPTPQTVEPVAVSATPEPQAAPATPTVAEPDLAPPPPTAAATESTPTVRIAGTVDVSSAQGQGGIVTVEAEHIRLTDSSTLLATGATGGGAVLVGGDWQGGANAERRVFDDPNALRQATTVTMKSGAQIDASATGKGDGGTVVLWSDIRGGSTTFAGQILARGGAQAGRGGLVETSGHSLQIETTGHVDTTAAQGATGDWLIDPVNFSISAGTGAQTTSSIGASTLVNNLLTNNVTIATSGDTTGNGDITIASNVVSSSANSLTLKAHGNIIHNNNVTVSTSGGAVTYWADSDNNASGDIQFPGVATINTGGGRLTMAGGADSGAGTPQGSAVRITATGTFNRSFNTAGGDVLLKASGPSVGFNAIDLSRVSIDSGAGSITIEGVNSGTNPTTSNGIYLKSGTTLASSKTSGTAISISGVGAYGLTMMATSADPVIVKATGGGNINMSNTAVGVGSNRHLYFLKARVLTSTGDITINSNEGVASADTTAVPTIIGKLTGHVDSSSGSITINTDDMIGGNLSFDTSGQVTIQPFGSSFTGLTTDYITWAPSITGLTLGKSGNTGNIAVASAISINGPIAIHSSGTVTQTAALTAPSLALYGNSGVGNFTLNHASNNIGTLAASGVGNLSYWDSNALTIGTVGATHGIVAAGTVDIQTLTGDLTVAQNVSTTNTTSSALLLNAGKSAAAGTASGGNVVLSGSPTISGGAGSTARVFTGQLTSTGNPNSLVTQGLGRFRYNADELTNFATGTWTNLGAGSYVIYRERPSVNITNANSSMEYGDALPGMTATGLVNGDLASYSVTSPVYQGSTGRLVPGTYGTSTNLAGLGYNLSGSSSGNLAVSPRTVGLSATKVADGDDTLTGNQVTLTTGVTGEDLVYSNAFADSSVEGANGNFIRAIVLGDGTSGVATNYRLPVLNAANAPVTITGVQFASLTAVQLAALSATQQTSLLSNLTALDLASMSNAAIAAIKPETLAGFSTGKLGSLSAAQISQFSSAQLIQLSASGLWTELSTAQVAGLTAAQLTGLSSAQVAGFTAAQLGGLTAAQLSGLSAAQQTALLSGLTAAKLAGISNAALAAIEPTTLVGFSSGQLASLSAAQIGQLSSAQLIQLSASSLWTDLSTVQVAGLTAAQLTGLSSAQVAGFTAAQLGGLTAAQLSGLSAAQQTILLANLNATKLAGMSNAALAAIEPTTLSGLQASQLSLLSLSQINALTTAQRSSLTSAQLAVLPTNNNGTSNTNTNTNTNTSTSTSTSTSTTVLRQGAEQINEIQRLASQYNLTTTGVLLVPRPSAQSVNVALQGVTNSQKTWEVVVTVPTVVNANRADFEFEFELPLMIQKSLSSTPDPVVSMGDGGPLPDWLRFDPLQGLMALRKPADVSFPIEVTLILGRERVNLVIDEPQ